MTESHESETKVIERALRRRINIKETAKHELYFDVTVDATGYTLEEQMAEVDAAVAEASKRCIPQA